MGFSSVDDLVAKMSAGKSLLTPYNKVTGAAAYAVGRWYNMFMLAGQPSPGAYSGTSLAVQTLNDQSPGAIWHGGNVAPETKHLLNVEALATAATGVPNYLLLVDLLAYYPGINLNTGSQQNFTGSAGGSNVLPTRGGVQHSGANVYGFLEAGATTGASAANMAMDYTNSAGVSGRALGATVALTASAIVPHIIHSGVAANNFGPFLPMAQGDLGIRSVQSVTIGATGSVSNATLVLCEPLAKIPLAVAQLATARDFLFNVPSLPRIKDGACLAFLQLCGAATAANTNFFAMLDLAWG